jgi:hypothetical protein
VLVEGTAAYSADDLILRDALQLYFAQYHFKDGGYNDRWFKIKLGPVLIPLPNIKARVAAVKIHDVHHVLTGYRADWKGEVEIAGWELASGCGRYWVAWLLNSEAFVIGLFLYPRAVFAAFRKGRTVGRNLYHGTVYDDALLSTTVGELRRRHGVSRVEAWV